MYVLDQFESTKSVKVLFWFILHVVDCGPIFPYCLSDRSQVGYGPREKSWNPNGISRPD